MLQNWVKEREIDWLPVAQNAQEKLMPGPELKKQQRKFGGI